MVEPPAEVAMFIYTFAVTHHHHHHIARTFQGIISSLQGAGDIM